MNAKTLVEEIVVCIESGAPNHEVTRLGREYISLCEYSKERLIRCIDFIREGKESTALQEAQFSPPLMPALEALSFPQQDDWRKVLKRNGLRVPSYFDEKHISMMRELFSKEIDGTDPLYSELAHAMRKKDMPGALNILRIIHHKNPKDKNAENQLSKIEKKTQQARIEELQALAREQKEEAFKETISAFEDEPWKKKPSGDAWSEVDKYDQQLVKIGKLKQCKGMVSHLFSLKEKKSLEYAIRSLKQIDALVSENDLSLDDKFEQNNDDSYAEVVESVRNWIAEEKRQRQKRADDKVRENNLKLVIRSIQDKQIGPRKKIEELREDLALLTSAARDLEQVGQSLSESDLNTFNNCLYNLRSELAQRQKRLRWIISSTCLFFVAAIGLSFFFLKERMKWNEEFQILLNGVKANQNVENLEDFLDSFEQIFPLRLTDIEFDAVLKKNRTLIADARSLNDVIGQKIKAILGEISEADEMEELSSLFGRKKLLWEDLNRVNIAYLEHKKTQLREVDLRWNQQRDSLQSELSKILEKKISEASTFSKENLKVEQEPKLLEASLSEFNEMLIELETDSERYSKVEGLGLSQGQKDLLSSMRKNYQKKKAALESYEQVLVKIQQADSVDSYLISLEQLVKSGLTGAPHFKDAKQILLSKKFFLDAGAKRFMPSSPQLWRTAPDMISSAYVPQQVLPKESEPIQKVINEERTKNIFRSPFYSSENLTIFEAKNDCWMPIQKGTILSTKWTKGKNFGISMDFQRAQVSGYGSYYVTQKAMVVSGTSIEEQTFKSQWFGITKSFTPIEPPIKVINEVILGGSLNKEKSLLSAESEFLHGSSSSFRKTFLSGSVMKAPLLFLDLLNKEKIDPYIKAHVFQAVFKCMSFRPQEWGLKNNLSGNLSVIVSGEKLNELIGDNDLVASWYQFISTRKETVLRKDLLKFFESESFRSYFKEAKFYEKFWSELLSANFKFKAYCNLDGGWSDSRTTKGWAIQDTKGGLRLVNRNKDQVLPLSPILSLDREPLSIIKKSLIFAGFENFKDEQFKNIKETLPYPFNTMPLR